MPSVIRVDESEEQVEFNVMLISGVISRDIVIEFFSEDGTAQGT